MRRNLKLAAGILPIALLAAACSGDGEAAPTSSPSSTTTSTAATTSSTTNTSTTSTTRPPLTTTIPDPDPLVVLTDEPVAAALAPAADAFEAETGIPVEFRTASLEEIRAGMLAGDAGADVFLGPNRWTAELVAAGAVRAIDLGSRSGDWLDVAVAGFEHRDAVYALPFAVEGVAFYRNTDLVDEPASSFEDVREICDGLGDGIEWCLGHPATDDGLRHHAFVASGDAYLFGGTPGRYDVADVGLDHIDAVDSLTVLDTLVEGGYAPDTGSYEGMLAGFADGRSPFLIGGSEALAVVEEAEIPVTVENLPPIAGERAVPLAVSTGFWLASGSEQPAAALLFLFDHVSTAEVAARAVSTPHGLPALVDAAGSLSESQATQGLLTSIASGRPVPNVPEVEAALDAVGEAVAAVYARDGEPEAILEDAVRRIRAAITDG